MQKQTILAFLKEIKPQLKDRGIDKIALFGSFARNENNVYSDIDIAIQKEPNYLRSRSAYDYFDEIKNIQQMLRKKLHRNSDIFDLDSNSSMLKTIQKDLIYV